jgi:hypothetical protein
MELLEPRQYLAAVSWDGGGNDSAWSNPLNWSGDALPGNGDDVVIDSAGTTGVVLASGAAAVHSLVLFDNLNISGGSLSISGSLTINAGQLTTNARLSVIGSTTVANAGILTAAGDVELNDWGQASGGQIVASAGSLKVGSKTAGAGVQVLSGATLTSTGDNNLDNFVLGNDSKFVNRGSLTVSGSYSLVEVDFTNSGTLDWDTTGSSIDGSYVSTKQIAKPWTADGTGASQGLGSSTESVTVTSSYHFNSTGQSFGKIENAVGSYNYEGAGVSVSGSTTRHSTSHETVQTSTTGLTRTTDSSDLWTYSSSLGTINTNDQPQTGLIPGDATGTFTRSSQSSGTIDQSGGGTASSQFTASYAWDDLNRPTFGTGNSFVNIHATHTINTSGGYQVDTTFDSGSSHLSGAHGYAQTIVSNSMQSVSYSVDTDGQWAMVSGYADAIGTSTDLSWYESQSGSVDFSSNDSGTLTGSITGTYSQSSSASGSNSEGGSSSTTTNYSVHSNWSGETWLQTGHSTSEWDDSGFSGVATTGSYHSTIVTPDGSSSVNGFTNNSSNQEWSNIGTITQTLDADGQWVIISGEADTTGTSTDTSSYQGGGDVSQDSSSSGPLTGGVPGTYSQYSSAAGSNSEGGSNYSSTSYFINSQWAGGTWVQTGQSTTDWDDSGHSGVTTSGEYGYSVVMVGSDTGTDGSTGTANDQEWTNIGTITQSLNAEGQWVIISGEADVTVISIDSSSYDGDGNVTQGSSDSGALTGGVTGTYSQSSNASGSNSEGGSNYTSTSYFIHTQWAGGTLVQTGESTSDWNDSGFTGIATNGTYNSSNETANSNSSTDGFTGAANDQSWTNTGSITQTLSVDGQWIITAGQADFTWDSSNDTIFAGSGESSQTVTTVTVLSGDEPGSATRTSQFEGSHNEEGSTHASVNYTINSNWSGGALSRSGSRIDRWDDYGKDHDAGEGGYSYSVTTDTGNSLTQGQQSYESDNQWSSDGHLNQTLDPSGTWVGVQGHDDFNSTVTNYTNYSGEGNYSDASDVTTTDGPITVNRQDSISGTNVESGDTSSSFYYHIRANWVSGAWNKEGLNRNKWTEQSGSTQISSGQYDYAASTPTGSSSGSGTKESSRISTAESMDRLTQTLNNSDDWSVISGEGSYSARTIDTWSYVGDGESNDVQSSTNISGGTTTSSNHSLQGTTAESGNGNSLSSVSLHYDWNPAITDWYHTGKELDIWSEVYNSSNTKIDIYSRSTVNSTDNNAMAGTAFYTTSNIWGGQGSITHTLSSDENWTVDSGNFGNFSNTIKTSSYSGEGTHNFDSAVTSTNVNAPNSEITNTIITSLMGFPEEHGSSFENENYVFQSDWDGSDWVDIETASKIWSSDNHTSVTLTGDINQSTSEPDAPEVVTFQTITHLYDYNESGYIVQTRAPSGQWQVTAGQYDSTENNFEMSSSTTSANYTISTDNSIGSNIDVATRAGTISDDRYYQYNIFTSIHTRFENTDWIATGQVIENIEYTSHWTAQDTEGTFERVSSTPNGHYEVEGDTEYSKLRSISISGDVTQSLGDDQSWHVSGGNIEKDISASEYSYYTGTGTGVINDTGLPPGDIDFDGSTSSSVHYHIESQWTDNHWLDSGTSQTYDSAGGYWHASASGPYDYSASNSAMIGSRGVDNYVSWGATTSLAYSLGEDEGWVQTYGKMDSSRLSNDSWWYSSDGNTNNSGQSTSLHQGGGGSYMDDSATTALFQTGSLAQNWVTTGHRTLSNTDYGSWTVIQTASYSRAYPNQFSNNANYLDATVTGVTTYSTGQDWSYNSTVSQQLSNSNQWQISSVTNNNTYSDFESTQSIGSGSYTRWTLGSWLSNRYLWNPAGLWVVTQGTINEDNFTSRSRSFSTYSSWDSEEGPSNATGRGTASNVSSGSRSFNGSGESSINPTGPGYAGFYADEWEGTTFAIYNFSNSNSYGFSGNLTESGQTSFSASTQTLWELDAPAPGSSGNPSLSNGPNTSPSAVGSWRAANTVAMYTVHADANYTGSSSDTQDSEDSFSVEYPDYPEWSNGYSNNTHINATSMQKENFTYDASRIATLNIDENGVSTYSDTGSGNATGGGTRFSQLDTTTTSTYTWGDPSSGGGGSGSITTSTERADESYSFRADWEKLEDGPERATIARYISGNGLQTLTEEYQATDSAGSVIYSSEPSVYVQGAYGYTDIVVPDNPGFGVAYNGELAPRWNYWSYNPLSGLNFAGGSGNTPGGGANLASGATGTADNPIGNPPPNARFDITTPPSLVPDSPPTNVTPATKASPQTPGPIKPLPPNLQTPKKSDLNQWSYLTKPETLAAAFNGGVDGGAVYLNSASKNLTGGKVALFDDRAQRAMAEARIQGDSLSTAGFNAAQFGGAVAAGTVQLATMQTGLGLIAKVVGPGGGRLLATALFASGQSDNVQAISNGNLPRIPVVTATGEMIQAVRAGDWEAAGSAFVGLTADVSGLKSANAGKLAKGTVSEAVGKGKTSSAAAGGGDLHHIMTNKNNRSKAAGGPYTQKFKALAAKRGITLEDAMNKMRLPNHQGPHPEYNSEVYRELKKATNRLNGDAFNETFDKTMERLRIETAAPGTLLNKLATGG